MLPRDDKDLDDVDCWTAGTTISMPNGDKPIEEVVVGDMVNTPIGPRKVLKSYDSGLSETVKVTLKDGAVLEGTPNHKVMVNNIGLMALKDLKCSSELVKENNSCLSKLIMMESHTQNLQEENIIRQMEPYYRMEEQVFIGKSGSITMDLSQKDSTYITLIMTQIIMQLKTWKSFLHRIMQGFTLKNVGNQEALDRQETNGLKMVEENCYEKTLKRCVTELPKKNLRALIVNVLLQQNTMGENIVLSVQKSENQKVINQKHVLFAVVNSFIKNIQQKKSKHAVQNVVGSLGRKKVYNLTIEQAGLFYANGVLSSNTDSEDHIADETRYYLRSLSNRSSSFTTTGNY